MSCNYHVFIGPYLEVHNPIKSTTEKIRSCANPKCGWFKSRRIPESSQFCGQCGEKIRHVDMPAKGRKEFNAYDEFDGERLTEITHEGMPKESENYVLFQSNINDCAGRTFYDSTEIVPMDQNTPQAEIAEFAAAFPKEIARITEVFGEAAVKIKWGAVAYWS